MKKEVDVIIIGAGLTGLTTAFYLKKAGKKVIVLERDNRAGGVMRTNYDGDFTFETGPVSGSMGSPEMAELFEDLEGQCDLEIANEASKQRWIWKNGAWRALPSGILSGITTPLFSWSDKFRLLGEPFRKPGTDPHESLADMVKRRMGKSFLNYAIDPFIGGIYAGDPSTLVTKYALPKLYNLEQNYGSFIGGAMKKGKTTTARDKKATKDVFTTKGGIQNLINALATSVGKENILLGENRICITTKDEGGYTATVTGGEISAPKVISTTGGTSIASLFPFIEKKHIATIEKLKYAKVTQAVVGYKKWTGKELKAFGGLIPSIENRQSLGILFTSSLFTNRAPEDGALMTIFMGGIKKPEFIDKTNKEIKAIALNEIKETLGCDAKPDLIKIARYPQAIPQYDASSKERLQSIADIEKQHDGLFLAGNIRDGIGMSDRVKQAKKLAETLS